MPAEPPTEAFQEFTRNLEYARQLVGGGRRLGQLRVGAFDVDDLYRAAWVQAVAALDHWITREIIDRAVTLAQNPSITRPPNFNKLKMPVELFERVHYEQEPIDAAFRAFFEQTFEFRTFQAPDKIKEGFAHVSTVKLWVRVAEIMDAARSDDEPITPDIVRQRLDRIAKRRNAIAHTADRDPTSPTMRAAITADETLATINWLQAMAAAIQEAVGQPTVAPDYDSGPEDDAGPTAEVRLQKPGHRRDAEGTSGAEDAQVSPPENLSLTEAPSARADETFVRQRHRWDETDLLESIENHCPPDVARTLLSVYRHAEKHPAFQEYRFGTGAQPSVTAWFSIGTDDAPVWSIYTGVSMSALSINFEWMQSRGASTEVLSKLAHDLRTIRGWRHLPAKLESDDYRRRPSIGMRSLAVPSTAETVITALNDLLSPTG
ncbi:hypothetical protein GCM10010151_10310 [Actinoallomurus spadix]|uniref:RiboL-PSP-HEPN domain-containing protein n=1 Tax=Actinoallomurus spadix TaxID=79912 RepID=A0ABN0W142_9ACTN